MATEIAEVEAQQDALPVTQDDTTEVAPSADSVPAGDGSDASGAGTEGGSGEVAPPSDLDSIWADEEKRSVFRERFLAEDDGVKRHIEQAKADAANQAVQKREADLRREAGKDERITANIMQVLKEGFEAGGGEWEPDTFDQRTVNRLKQALSLPLQANLELVSEGYEKSFAQWFVGQEVSPETRTKIEQVRQEHGERSGPYFNAMREALEASIRANYDKDVRAEAVKVAAQEKLADEQLVAKKNGISPPASPGGGRSGGGLKTWADVDKQYTDSQWAALPAARRAEITAQIAGGN